MLENADLPENIKFEFRHFVLNCLNCARTNCVQQYTEYRQQEIHDCCFFITLIFISVTRRFFHVLKINLVYD